jgi:NAD(P)-dependent dehydrogenase (short-subunit alcohol dehydrogenase family)
VPPEAFCADISTEEDCRKAAEGAAAAFGDKIHILVNNAALFIFKSVEHASGEFATP